MKKSELKALLKIIAEEVVAAKKARIQESKGLSGFKKSSDKVEHTEKIADAKTLTPNSEPKEKKEGKKLPVKDNTDNTETDHMVTDKNTPETPASEKEESKARPVGGHGALKEEILAMIRESIMEMGRTAGAIGSKYKVADPSSPTGWVVKGHKTIPDGTPTEAPKNQATPALAEPKVTDDAGAEEVADDEDDVADDEAAPEQPETLNTKVSIVVDGDELPAKLDMAKIKGPALPFLKSILKGNNILMIKADPSVQDKLDQLSDLYIDDKLPADASLNLSIQRDGSIKSI